MQNIFPHAKRRRKEKKTHNHHHHHHSTIPLQQPLSISKRTLPTRKRYPQVFALFPSLIRQKEKNTSRSYVAKFLHLASSFPFQVPTTNTFLILQPNQSLSTFAFEKIKPLPLCFLHPSTSILTTSPISSLSPFTYNPTLVSCSRSRSNS